MANPDHATKHTLTYKELKKHWDYMNKYSAPMTYGAIPEKYLYPIPHKEHKTPMQSGLYDAAWNPVSVPKVVEITPNNEDIHHIEDYMKVKATSAWGGPASYNGTSYQVWLQEKYQELSKDTFRPDDKAYDELRHIALDRVNEMFMRELKEKRIGHSDVRYGTQKVNGIKKPYSARTIPGTLELNYVVFPYHMPQDISENTFARPAPTRPRHGFVESRVVEDWDDLLSLYREAVAQDPDAEIILMPKIIGNYSAVATNAGVSWGKGNDGATSGEGSLFIPAPLSLASWNRKVAGSEPKEIGIKHCAYVELVEGETETGNDGVFIVQRRDGPEPPVTLDYIPRDITIEKIIINDGLDLLAWEKLIQSYTPKQISGMVFDNRGGTLASHYAVHAIEHGMAVVCSDRPLKIGAVLSAQSERPSLTPNDYHKLAKRVKHWWSKEFDLEQRDDMRNQVRTVVGSIHSMASVWDARPELIELRAMAVSSIARLMTAASFGELRHWYDVGPGNEYSRESGLYKGDCYKIDPETPNVSQSGRTTAWKKVIVPMSFNEAKKLNKIMALDYEQCGWNSGFGGEAWAAVAQHTYNLVRALQHYVNNPREDTWSKVVLAANTALHTAHNGGVALNKWVDSDTLDLIAEVPVFGFTNSFAANLVMESAGK